jgi:hypothetical protein
MDESHVYLDGAQRLKTAVEAKFGAMFNYFIGTPLIMPPEAAYPVMIFQKVSGHVEVGASGADDLTEQILIQIIFNDKEGYGTPDDDDTVMRKIFTLVEGRDPTSGTYLADTIMYVIRKNLTLSSTVIDHAEDINYDVTTQQDQSTLAEAIITVKFSERIIVGSRT